MPPEAAAEASRRYHRRSPNVLWERMVETLSRRRYLEANVPASVACEDGSTLLVQVGLVCSGGCWEDGGDAIW